MVSLPYLAIVTARGGSKRIPRKNILNFAGKPLIAWSIQAGLRSTGVAKVFVSTDCEDIREVALASGADCPSLRSSNNSTDIATSASVVHEVLRELESELHLYAGLVLLQPTSPLRTSHDIDSAILLHRSSGAAAVVSVCETECPPAWTGQLSASGFMDDFIRPDYKGKRSQDMNTSYRINGAVYVIGFDAFRVENGFLPVNSLAYIMPRERSIDIDNPTDIVVGEALAGLQLNR